MSRRAYYSATVINFLSESSDSIIGKIVQNHSQNLEHLQTGAWRQQIEILRRELRFLQGGQLLLEVLIPRMGRRADAILIYRNLIFVLEFKIGAQQYFSQDLRQTHGYAVDLSCFHEGSHNKTIIPILIATEAISKSLYCRAAHDRVFEPITTNKNGLGSAIEHCVAVIETPEAVTIDDWLSSKYKPTPSIVEAAQALYSNHDVQDIARNDAGAKNLHSTSKRVQEIVHEARINRRKTICFITGVPGAGKTLVGLNLATSNARSSQDEHAVFLSGNGPLVEVLREALARDQVERNATQTKAEALRKVEQIIQNIHHFRDEYLQKTEVPPPEKVVIFDEAQRAWDLHSTSKFMAQKRGLSNFGQSEPEFLMSVMDRHQDWCVVVALIGGGQEINTGEAGLKGWINALESRFKDWDVFFSDKLSQPEYAGGEVDFSAVNNCRREPDLHLAISMRSFKAEKLSHMVHYLIHNEPSKALEYFQGFKHKFPIAVSRDLQQAKAWIKANARGNETKGIVASAGALRLKPDGIFVKNRLVASDWFLNSADDVRSCHFLEDVATEFDIQGLEVDWCLVAWDADYRYKEASFEYWKFTGTTWKKRQQESQKRFLENAYRVLLTRARQGMVIFVPHGDNSDLTRQSAFYNDTFSYLVSCGLEPISN